MSLTQWGAALVGCATLLLTACTVVDLDENGKPIIPADPQAKASFDNQTPDQIAQQTWQSRVLEAAQQHVLDASALTTRLKAPSPAPESVFVRLTSQIDSVDTTNGREHTIVVRVNDMPVTIQIGPVMLFAMPVVSSLKILLTRFSLPNCHGLITVKRRNSYPP